MKSNFTFLLLISLIFLGFNSLKLNAQNLSAKGGEYIFNKDNVPCLTEQQREDIRLQLMANYNALKSQNRLAFTEGLRVPNPAFVWPLKKTNGLAYNDVWGISNYVDQNPTYPDQLLDYNCGAKTYDLASGYNHRGIDMFTWPFGWKMMDDDSVEIIAASAGQIVAKGDGEFDRNCGFNNDVWNAVYVQHNDGSVALYGHMKSGSLTAKNVGDMVVQGEYLGVVGSSGSSTGPHLHFEVYTDINLQLENLVDTYSGACNSLNTESWWINQKPYINPNINAVLTHSNIPDFGTCPDAETTNESDEFSLNDTVYFAIFMRDQMAGTSINLKTTRPDNSIQYNWNFNFTDDYVSSWWYWNFAVDMEGEWTWEATYEGQTVSHTFNVGTLSIEDEDFNNISVYPNPSKDIIYVNSNTIVKKATLTNVLGKTIKFLDGKLDGLREVDLSNLSNGLYFLTLEGDDNQKKTMRIVKK